MLLTISLLIALLIGSAAFIAMPLMGGRKVVRREEEREAALLDREMALQLLRDLHHDHLTGKIDDRDFESQNAATEAIAIAAMKRADALGLAEGADPYEFLVRQERIRLQRGAQG